MHIKLYIPLRPSDDPMRLDSKRTVTSRNVSLRTPGVTWKCSFAPPITSVAKGCLS